MIRQVGKREDKTKKPEKGRSRIAQEEGGRQKWEHGWSVRGGRERAAVKRKVSQAVGN